MIIDCKILDGNPADTTLVDDIPDRQEEIFGRYPLKTSLMAALHQKVILIAFWIKALKMFAFPKGETLILKICAVANE